MQIFSISQLTSHIKQRLETDYRLSNVWVRGEISNFKKPASGHLYFVLKDPASCIKAVMFKSRSMSLTFNPADGMKVIIRGYVTVYERDGQYQLYVEEVQPDGVGALHLAFEQLKEKLDKEGLFDPARKKSIPVLPGKIGIVTSQTGAVLRDILTVAGRRFPGLHLIIAPAAVQGYHAPQEIAAALNNLNNLDDLDLIIVARGGGSLEELWAFNTELVARTIASSRIPVVSAVGHETDYTIADFVADLRAPTPSAAAEMVVPLKEELADRITLLKNRLVRVLNDNLFRYRIRVKQLAESRAFSYTAGNLADYRKRVDGLTRALSANTFNLWRAKGSKMAQLGGRLAVLNPLATLERGYAACFLPDANKLLTSVSQVEPGNKVQIYLRDGKINCSVLAVEEGQDEEKKQ